MSTADRVDPVYRAWVQPVAVPDAPTYVGRHRRRGARSFSLHRMFYSARHFGRGR